ncbi:MAG: hypothetical protein QOJ42_6660, partial [Acidobacteriaceae bacterium]|nr:hypothetical protein [Acidobacteriaceae bacterium]
MRRRDLLKMAGFAAAGATSIATPVIAEPIDGPSQVSHQKVVAAKADNGTGTMYRHATVPTQFVEA